MSHLFTEVSMKNYKQESIVVKRMALGSNGSSLEKVCHLLVVCP